MGYHIILDVECVVTADHIDNFASVFDRGPEGCPDDHSLDRYRDLWKHLDIDDVYKFELDESTRRFALRIEKKPHQHDRCLIGDYMRLVKEVIVPLTEEVTTCTVSHDDYDIPPTVYTDDQLRGASYLAAFEPKRAEVQYGQRRAANQEPSKLVSFVKLYPDITDSDPDTWPQSLRCWWRTLNYIGDTGELTRDLRTLYPEDAQLVRIADWLDAQASSGLRVEFRRDLPGILT